MKVPFHSDCATRWPAAVQPSKTGPIDDQARARLVAPTLPSADLRKKFSIFFSQHDGNDAFGDRWVCCIWRMVGEALVEIIDLEKDHLAFGFERTKIVFFMRIVGATEIVVHGDCFDDASDSFGAECGDTVRHHSSAFVEVMTQSVVEGANPVGLSGRHGNSR